MLVLSMLMTMSHLMSDWQATCKEHMVCGTIVHSVGSNPF